jgi:hypothetical protein
MKRKQEKTLSEMLAGCGGCLVLLLWIVFIKAVSTAIFFGIFALVISIGGWQVDHRAVLAVAVLCAFLWRGGGKG